MAREDESKKQDHNHIENSEAAENAAGESSAVDEGSEQALPEPEQPELSEIEILKAEWEKEREELKARLLRKQADFDNFRRISRAEQEETREYALFKFLEKLLPVLDNMERAIDSARSEAVPDSYREGLEMIHRQMLQLLEQEGVTVMDSLGQPFDPNYHHAVLQVEEGEPGCVAEELQKGYLYKQRVLRPAMVKVCRS
ncbi:MAG TPA: nucleotide exchange factor GrpE [Bacillota bacterium]|nr:nucleotide exchange factor GrpE [Bacillota bacterium]